MAHYRFVCSHLRFYFFILFNMKKKKLLTFKQIVFDYMRDNTEQSSHIMQFKNIETLTSYSTAQFK